MSNLPLLAGPALPPATGQPPRQVVLLLHGVGADGNDLIGLAPLFQQILPEAAFFSPNAPHRFDMAPFGYQWFSLRDFGPEARLEGTRAAAPILDHYIDHLLAIFGLNEENMALIGFSQGTMMALHVGLRRARPLAGIVGYSGMLVGAEFLADEIRARPPVLLVHGAADGIVPVESLDQAKTALDKNKVPVRAHVRPGIAHGIDEEGIRLGQEFLREALGKNA
ncbi:MAG: phospholipase [Rhodospirillales bacterium RIFCSPLOWO2_12_FULL_67_15]|nr:MAG: phospholipase [Rhodospirillales bacterium RIFCSPLOWO2_12_FULL_67_15]